jgi:Leucine-rich repeat (LRR) protein
MTSEPKAVVFGVEAVEITSNFDVLKKLNLSWTNIKSLPESIVRLVNLKQLEVLDLERTAIRDLPKNPRWPMLLELFLHNNKELRKIPPLFFDYMTALQTLNLSRTCISSLPKSIVNLASLKRLILRNCHDFKKLSPEVGELKELEVLDLEGTKIWDLPENPKWPRLLQFVLHNNKELRKIPPLFFDYMTALQTLDLSGTCISSLPESIVNLASLKRLILRNCRDFKKLSPEVGELKELEVLDLEGT